MCIMYIWNINELHACTGEPSLWYYLHTNIPEVKNKTKQNTYTIWKTSGPSISDKKHWKCVVHLIQSKSSAVEFRSTPVSPNTQGPSYIIANHRLLKVSKTCMLNFLPLIIIGYTNILKLIINLILPKRALTAMTKVMGGHEGLILFPC